MFRKSLGLAVFAVFALPLAALAQEAGDGDASPRSTLVISSWKCDIGHIGDIVAAVDSISRPVYMAMKEEGLVISWGTYFHDWADEWNVNFYTVTEDKAAFFAAQAEAGRRIEAIVGPDAPSPVADYCTSHKDGIFVLGPRTQ